MPSTLLHSVSSSVACFINTISVAKRTKLRFNVNSFSTTISLFSLLILTLLTPPTSAFPSSPSPSDSLSGKPSSRRDWIVSSSSGISSLIMSTSMPNSVNAAVDGDGRNEGNPTKVIRWGIVGLGDVTKVKSGPPFYKCDNSELVAVMRRTPGKAKEFAADVPGGKCIGYDNLENFLQHPELDAVYVSTRPGTQNEICQAVANAGLACYVEKPVGRCAEETKQIVDLFQSKGLPFYTAYISRAYTRTQKLLSLLYDDQVLGDQIDSISYELIGTGGARDMDTVGELPWRLQAKQSGGGLIMDVGCHIVDRLEYIAGNSALINVKGSAENHNSVSYQDVEDYVSFQATIGAPLVASPGVKCEGALVECAWNFAPAEGVEPKDELIIRGPKGSLKMIGMSPNGPIELFDTNGKVIKEYPFPMPQHTAQQLIQATTNDLLIKLGRVKADEIDKNNNSVLSYGENAIRTQQVLDECLAAYYGGREIGYWDRSPDTWPGLQ